jgi:hypothetical protein
LLALLCLSLVLVSGDVEAAYHISFNRQELLLAGLSVAALGCCVPLFAASHSPLGFAASFYLLTITAGYLWLSYSRRCPMITLPAGFRPRCPGWRSRCRRCWDRGLCRLRICWRIGICTYWPAALWR